VPTSNWQNITHSLELIRSWMPESILDIGCGFGRWGFLCREFLDVWEGRYDRQDWKVKIEGVEGFAPYVTDLQRAVYDRIHIGNVLEVLPRLGRYDLIILGDVLEHFEKDEGARLIADCASHLSSDGHLLLHVPLGEDWPQGAAFGNDLETHRSCWTETDLWAQGCTVTRFQDYIQRPFAVAVLPPLDHRRLTSSA